MLDALLSHPKLLVLCHCCWHPQPRSDKSTDDNLFGSCQLLLDRLQMVSNVLIHYSVIQCAVKKISKMFKDSCAGLLDRRSHGRQRQIMLCPLLRRMQSHMRQKDPGNMVDVTEVFGVRSTILIVMRHVACQHSIRNKSSHLFLPSLEEPF